MKNKYYIPSIEEFHVGFEYEQYEDYDVPNKSREWHKITYGNNRSDNPENMQYPFPISKNIRVKHLDREDIESLGFEGDYIDPEGNIWFRSKSLRLCLCKFTEYNIWIVDNLNATLDDTMFKGKVKNKSELGELLKQLEIYENS